MAAEALLPWTKSSTDIFLCHRALSIWVQDFVSFGFFQYQSMYNKMKCFLKTTFSLFQTWMPAFNAQMDNIQTMARIHAFQNI